MDYISFIGFFIYYVDSLPVTILADSSRNDSNASLSPVQSAHVAPYHTPDTTVLQGMILILGGYSYGSLITTLLPDIEFIINQFANVNVGSAEAEIKLRALHLSAVWNSDILARSRLQRDKTLKAQNKAVVVGGEESELRTRRPSGDTRRSMETIRKSVDYSRRKLGLRRNGSGETKALSLEPALLHTKPTVPNTCYLLISPLRPPISSFMTMFSKFQHHDDISADLRRHHEFNTSQNLTMNPTLAIYGDSDFFTSQKKLRKWVEDLARKNKKCFQFQEVASAGHFWQEEGVEAQLRSTVSDWLKHLLNK